MTTLTPAQEKVQKEIDKILAFEPNILGVQSDSELLWNVADNMRATAGSFVRQLGELYLRADSENQHKILKTWPNYFLQYAV